MSVPDGGGIHPGEEEDRALLGAAAGGSQNFQEFPVTHESIRRRTFSHCLKHILLVASFALFGGLRIYVFVFFCRQLGQKNEAHIGVAVFAHFGMSAIGPPILSALADKDKWAFDRVLGVFLVFGTLFLIVEASATTFAQLAIGFAISGAFRPTGSFSQAFCIRMLPVQNSKKMSNLAVAVTSAFYLGGPIFAGVMGTLVSYRSCFIFCAACSLILTIYFFAYVNGTEAVLKEDQQTMQPYYERLYHENLTEHPLYPREYQFPAVFVSDDAEYQAVGDDKKEKESVGGADADEEEDQTIRKTSSMSQAEMKASKLPGAIEGFPLYCAVLAASTYMVLETVLATWYAPYMKSEHSQGLLVCNIQITFNGIFMAITIGASVRLLVPHDWFCDNAELIASVSNFLTAIIMGCAPLGGKAYFWAALPIAGVTFGMGMASLQVVLTKEQPPKATGAFAALRAVVVSLSRAVASLIVGVLWGFGPDHHWVWHVMVICLVYAIALLGARLWVLAFRARNERVDDFSTVSNN